MQDEVSGITPEGSGGEGWAGEGSPIKQMSPGWLPPLGDRVEERAKGQGTPAALVFPTPVLWDAKGVHDSSAATEHCDRYVGKYASFLEGSDSSVRHFL